MRLRWSGLSAMPRISPGTSRPQVHPEDSSASLVSAWGPGVGECLPQCVYGITCFPLRVAVVALPRWHRGPP